MDASPSDTDRSARARGESPERHAVVAELTEVLSCWGAHDVHNLQEVMTSLMDQSSDEELLALQARVHDTGATWGYHPPDPIARRACRATLQLTLQGSTLENAAALEIARSRPVIFMGNHLSFVDANAFDSLLVQAGYEEVADRVTTVVGPKVYALQARRLASLSFGTIKTAQSASRASGEVRLSKREVARLARDTLAIARERQELGDHLLVFAEGSRSRTGAMQRALAAVSRYLEHRDTLVLPLALVGTEQLMPVGQDRFHPTPVTARLGPPVEATRLLGRCDSRRALVMDSVGFLIASLLPPAYRGVYDGSQSDLDRAQSIAHSLLADA